MNKNIFFSLLVSSFILSACVTSGAQQAQPTVNSHNPRLKTSAIDNVMERALAQAEASGNKQEILAMLAQVHARNTDDPIVATRYARALREDDQINAAARTLVPYTTGKKKNIEALTEMAMAQLAQGNYKKAEFFAGQATKIDPKKARAFLAMGTAQDALKRHQDAEISFREGLKNWKGDPAPIMNNLALNLASQGHLEESLALLEKAQKISPQRIELERNRRIIATLLETTGPRPPEPNKKPVAKKQDAKEVAGKKTSKKSLKKEKKDVKKKIEDLTSEAEDKKEDKKMDVKIQAKTKITAKVKSLSFNE